MHDVLKNLELYDTKKRQGILSNFAFLVRIKRMNNLKFQNKFYITGISVHKAFIELDLERTSQKVTCKTKIKYTVGR